MLFEFITYNTCRAIVVSRQRGKDGQRFVAMQHGTIREAMIPNMQRHQNGQEAMLWPSVPTTIPSGKLSFH